MGRLIDEDVLLKNLEWLEDYDHYVLHDIEISLDETPTVKAIPVEWIRDYISHWVSEAYKNFVLHMIKNWEKENEKDI